MERKRKFELAPEVDGIMSLPLERLHGNVERPSLKELAATINFNDVFVIGPDYPENLSFLAPEIDSQLAETIGLPPYFYGRVEAGNPCSHQMDSLDFSDLTTPEKAVEILVLLDNYDNELANALVQPLALELLCSRHYDYASRGLVTEPLSRKEVIEQINQLDFIANHEIDTYVIRKEYASKLTDSLIQEFLAQFIIADLVYDKARQQITKNKKRKLAASTIGSVVGLFTLTGGISLPFLMSPSQEQPAISKQYASSLDSTALTIKNDVAKLASHASDKQQSHAFLSEERRNAAKDFASVRRLTLHPNNNYTEQIAANLISAAKNEFDLVFNSGKPKTVLANLAITEASNALDDIATAQIPNQYPNSMDIIAYGICIASVGMLITSISHGKIKKIDEEIRDIYSKGFLNKHDQTHSPSVNALIRLRERPLQEPSKEII